LNNHLWRGGVIGTNDLLYSSPERSTHLIMGRDYIEYLGGSWDGPGKPFHEYIHNFPDTEAVAKAQQTANWIYAPEVQIRHVHYQNSGVANDEVYQLGLKNYSIDSQTFHERFNQNLRYKGKWTVA